MWVTVFGINLLKPAVRLCETKKGTFIFVLNLIQNLHRLRWLNVEDPGVLSWHFPVYETHTLVSQMSQMWW